MSLATTALMRCRDHVRRLVVAFCVIFAAAFSARPASAVPVTFNFLGTLSGGYHNISPRPFDSIYLTVDSSAVASGNLVLQLEGSPCPDSSPYHLCSVSGDITKFYAIGVEIAGQD